MIQLFESYPIFSLSSLFRRYLLVQVDNNQSRSFPLGESFLASYRLNLDISLAQSPLARKTNMPRDPLPLPKSINIKNKKQVIPVFDFVQWSSELADTLGGLFEVADGEQAQTITLIGSFKPIVNKRIGSSDRTLYVRTNIDFDRIQSETLWKDSRESEMLAEIEPLDPTASEATTVRRGPRRPDFLIGFRTGTRMEFIGGCGENMTSEPYTTLEDHRHDNFVNQHRKSLVKAAWYLMISKAMCDTRHSLAMVNWSFQRLYHEDSVIYLEVNEPVSIPVDGSVDEDVISARDRRHLSVDELFDSNVFGFDHLPHCTRLFADGRQTRDEVDERYHTEEANSESSKNGENPEHGANDETEGKPSARSADDKNSGGDGDDDVDDDNLMDEEPSFNQEAAAALWNFFMVSLIDSVARATATSPASGIPNLVAAPVVKDDKRKRDEEDDGVDAEDRRMRRRRDPHAWETTISACHDSNDMDSGPDEQSLRPSSIRQPLTVANVTHFQDTTDCQAKTVASYVHSNSFATKRKTSPGRHEADKTKTSLSMCRYKKAPVFATSTAGRTRIVASAGSTSPRVLLIPHLARHITTDGFPHSLSQAWRTRNGAKDCML
jgi:hypothetical protein